MTRTLMAASLLVLAATTALASPEDPFTAVGKMKPVKKTDFFELTYKETSTKKKKKSVKAFVSLPEGAEVYVDAVDRIESLQKGDTLWLHGEPVERESQNSDGQTQVDRQIVNTAALATGEALEIQAGEEKAGKPRWLEAEVVRSQQGLHVSYQGSEDKVLLLKGHALLRRQLVQKRPSLKKEVLVQIQGEESEDRPEKAKEGQKAYAATRLILFSKRLQKTVYPLLLR